MTSTNKPTIQAFAEVALSHLSPELRFLLTCLRQAFHQTEVSENPKANLAKLNWDEFLSLVDRHRLAPVIYPFTPALVSQGLPIQVRDKIRQRFIRNTQRGLALSAELIRLSQTLAQQGVTIFPLKGPLLALQLYGDISGRHAGDLDFLVESRQVEKAWGILQNLGYRPDPPDLRLSPSQLAHIKVLRYHGTFYHTRKNIPVELHWRLINDRHEMQENDTRWFGDNVSYLKVGNHSLPCMPAQRLLLYLCIHGSTHFWGRLFWLYDVALLLQHQQDLDWDTLIPKAEELGCLRSLLLGTALCHLLLDVPVPKTLQDQWDRDPALMYLCRQSYPFFNHALSFPKNFAETIRFASYTAKLRGSLPRTIPFLVQKFFLPGYELPYAPVALFPIYFLLKPFFWIKSQHEYARQFNLIV
jgi:hypothetical protein